MTFARLVLLTISSRTIRTRCSRLLESDHLRSLTIDAFVSNLNNGGYVLVQSDDPGVVYAFVSKFIYWNNVNVAPVVDVADAVATGSESLAWARSAVKG